MKKITLIFSTIMMLFFVACEPSSDEEQVYGSVYGTVTDEDSNEPIVGANVVLSPGSLSTVTGNDGSYEFIDLEPQQYKLQVNKVGYTVNSRQLTISSGKSTPGDITMRKVKVDLSISISPTTYDFGTNSSELIMEIVNTSNTSSVDWASSGVDVEWLEISPSSGTIALGKTQSVKIKIDRSKIDADQTTHFLIEAGGGSESIAVKVSKAAESGTGIPSADGNSTKPNISESEHTIPTIPSPTFKVEATNSNIIRMEFNGIQKPGTSGASPNDFLQLFGTANENQNIWVEVDSKPMGFMVQNGSDLGIYEKAKADIVFLVDNSGSMDDEADKLAAQIIAWSSTLAQTMDVKFGCVGYDGLIQGAIDITDQNTLSSFLNRQSGASRTFGFEGSNAVTLQSAATTMNDSADNRSQTECDPMALHYANQNFNFRANTNRIFVNMTDEYSTSPIPAWSVETINPSHSTYNWSAAQGVIHTVWSGGNYAGIPTIYHSSEQPWLMSDYTGGTKKLDALADFSNVNLDELPVSGAILYSYVVLMDNTSGTVRDGSIIRITVKSADGKVIVVSEFEVTL